MCLCVSTIEGGPVELTFVQECVFLEKDGAKKVRVDLLIHNNTQTPVGRFRFELPCRLIEYSELTCRENESVEALYSRMCREQCSKVSIDTTKLIEGDASHNWFYKVSPSISISNWDAKKSTITVCRDEVENLTGFVKHNWDVNVSKEIGDDPWRWWACFVNGFTIVDFSTSNLEDNLRPGERMWISVEFRAPRDGMQYVECAGMWRRVFSRQRLFPVILLSQKAFTNWRDNQLTIFGRRAQQDQSKQKAGASKVRQLLLHSKHAQISDWRIFLHWSLRISIKRIDVPKEIVEPPTEHILQVQKKGFFHFWKEPNLDSMHRSEFWFGSHYREVSGVCSNGDEPPDGICIKLEAVVDNWIFSYLFPWLGFIGFWLGIWRLLKSK